MSWHSDQFTTDDLTLSLLSRIPALARQTLDSLAKTAKFMDDLARYEAPDGTEIFIKMWTPNKIIHALYFPNGYSLGDLVLSVGESIPEVIKQKAQGGQCSELLGHEIFEPYQWEGYFNDKENMLRIDLSNDVSLGYDYAHVGKRLAKLIAKKKSKDSIAKSEHATLRASPC